MLIIKNLSIKYFISMISSVKKNKFSFNNLLIKWMIKLLALPVLILIQGCCSIATITTLNGSIQTTSLLNLEIKNHKNLRIYTLPESCWPDQKKQEGTLPHRSVQPMYSGLDAMAIDRFNLLKDRKFAVLTNSTGRDHNLERGLELMIANGMQPQLLFEPEHGIYGHQDSVFRNGQRYDQRTQAQIISLYSKNKRPQSKHLKGLDLILVDIQNLPVRCYTYISTLTYILEAASDAGIEVMILDRAHPYVFFPVSGRYPAQGYSSFVAEADVPFLYSMTPAEYAIYLQDTKLPNLQLSIVKVANFSYDATDAALRGAWINPSPNIPSFESALVYPGVVFLEGVYFSLGRGTTRPFIYSGAPWVDSALVISRLNVQNLKGVQFSEVKFIASASHYKGRTSHGIQISPVSTEFDSLRTGYEYIRILRHLFPKNFKYKHYRDGRYFMDMLWGGPGYRQAIEANKSYEEFRKQWQSDSDYFNDKIKKYRLYE